MNTYQALMGRQRAEVHAFPFFFAFSQEQFEEGMASFGLAPGETDKIYSFGGTGGFYRREDAARLREMSDRHEREMDEAFAADTTGEGFIFDAFCYELADHEYPYSRNVGPALDALGLTWADVMASPALTLGLTLAEEALIEKARNREAV